MIRSVLSGAICSLSLSLSLGAAETPLPSNWDLDKGNNLLWKTDLPNGSAAAPLVAGDAVYVLSDPDLLSCHDLASGKERWRAFLGFAFPESDEKDAKVREQIQKARSLPPNEQKPCYEEAKKILGTNRFNCPELGFTTAAPVSDGERIFVCSGLGVVAAFDRSGKRVWRLEKPGNPRGGNWNPTPQLLGGFLIISGGAESIVALDPSTGAIKWQAKFAMPGGRTSIPAVWTKDQTQFLVAYDGTIVRVSDGKVFGSSAIKSWTEAAPIVVGDRAFFTRGGDHNTPEQFLEAFDLKLTGDQATLTPAWRSKDRRGETGKLFAFTRITPVLVGSSLASVTPSKSQVICLDALSDGTTTMPLGDIKIDIRSQPHNWNPNPVVSGDHFYLPGQRGVIYVLKMEGASWKLVHTSDFFAHIEAASTAAGKENSKKSSDRRSAPMILKADLVKSDGRLLVRTMPTLFCIGTKGP